MEERLSILFLSSRYDVFFFFFLTLSLFHLLPSFFCWRQFSFCEKYEGRKMPIIVFLCFWDGYFTFTFLFCISNFLLFSGYSSIRLFSHLFIFFLPVLIGVQHISLSVSLFSLRLSTYPCHALCLHIFITCPGHLYLQHPPRVHTIFSILIYPESFLHIRPNHVNL